MNKAIKIHCQHCAVWQIVPVLRKPKTVINLFQRLCVESDSEYIIFDIMRYTDLPHATCRHNFDGGGYYINGIPQSDEIHTDEDGKRHRIIGNFSLDFC